ncbi:hypothetical protein FDP41_012241 [Naegleria fowleri]|uniref:Uncharacterized protein n=1 Tax=Naegleria fowleri TaxID=5763 RepID=A0A6A5C544_NAEFO|nr:uncharacterized protein FDP41_012241 [Naegleria fowleri]KAF0981584.1 hypothetical protein FDP41_012241 [Naegleria fowleri]
MILFSKFSMENRKKDVQDDLVALSIHSDSNKNGSINMDVCTRPQMMIKFSELSSEILMQIAPFLSLFAFAKCHSSLLLLLFNQTKNMEKVPQDKEEHAEEGWEFMLVQLTSIWKPLMCYYFPKFEKSLNIKNWKHVLRRRIEHLMLYSPTKLPLTPKDPSRSCFETLLPFKIMKRTLLKIVNGFISVH